MGVATTYPELERLCQLLGRPIPRRPGFTVEPLDKAGPAMGPPSFTHHDRFRECHRG